MGTPQRGYRSPPPGDRVDALFNTGCRACWELHRDSSYMAWLNRGDPTPGPVSYTQIITLDDHVSTPVENQYLRDGRRVANVVIQDGCPGHHVDHLMFAGDDVTYQWIRHTRSRRGPADPRWGVVSPATSVTVGR